MDTINIIDTLDDTINSKIDIHISLKLIMNKNYADYQKNIYEYITMNFVDNIPCNLLLLIMNMKKIGCTYDSTLVQKCINQLHIIYTCTSISSYPISSGIITVANAIYYKHQYVIAYYLYDLIKDEKSLPAYNVASIYHIMANIMMAKPANLDYNANLIKEYLTKSVPHYPPAYATIIEFYQNGIHIDKNIGLATKYYLEGKAKTASGISMATTDKILNNVIIDLDKKNKKISELEAKLAFKN